MLNQRKMCCMKNLFIVILLCSIAHGMGQSILINEIMSDNESTITDEDGDYPDWIELLNSGSDPVNVNQFGLSDDPDEPFRWRLPHVEIASGKRMVLFASGKDRRDVIYWQNIIREGDTWRYSPGHRELSPAWKKTDFDDSDWETGPSGFGYGDGDDNTTTHGVSLFVRHAFHLDNTEDVIQGLLHIDFDDAFVAYLNGQEIARENIGRPGVRVRYNQTADQSHEAVMYQGGKPTAYEIENISGILQPGKNVLAIQVHNVSRSSSDLTLIPFFSLGRHTLPQNARDMPDILSLSSCQLHTSFRIDADGETLFLTDSTGMLLDSVQAPPLPGDISFARIPDGGMLWQLCAQPTPGAENVDSVYKEPAAPPVFSVQGGFFSERLKVELSDTSGSQGTIYYTRDGSVPDKTSRKYVRALYISHSTALRARIYRDGVEPSDIITHSYIFEDSPFPVVCLTSDEYNLFDEDYGIFAMGDGAESDYPYFGANFWQDWERPVHVEFYEPDGTPGFRINAGMQVFGGWSRGRDQKSVAIYARSRYGKGEIDYQIFPDKEIDTFEAFLLRNAGNDWDGTYFRDGYMQYLVKDVTDLEVMAFRPAHVYLNGDYWGILNLREKLNEHFVASNRGLDPDRMDFLGNGGGNYEVFAGTTDNYKELIGYIESHDLDEKEHFNHVAEFVDIDNYIDYMIAEIYFNNTDWPGNNIKYYRPTIPGGKWRWLIFDTDFGFGLYNTGYNENTLDFALEPHGRGWPNPPWSTFLFRSMMKNQFFRRRFAVRFTDLMNTVFTKERMLRLLDEFKNMFDPEIDRQQDRWPGAANAYDSRIRSIERFAKNRNRYMQRYIETTLDFSGYYELYADVADKKTGAIQINSKIIRRFPFQGKYLQKLPLTIKAIPAPGYAFSHWSSGQYGDSLEFTIYQKDNLEIEAVFKAASNDTTPVVINEINYHSSEDFPSPDWIELYNPTRQSVNLSGWTVTDSDSAHRFEMSAQTVLPARGFLIVTEDTTRLKQFYPTVSNFTGNLNFGFNNAGEMVRLFNPAGVPVDSVAYSDDTPWPILADGEGFTLELRQASADNASAVNWGVSAVYGGTPGAFNSIVTHTLKQWKTLPTRFSLEQNYPNPFNASTVIKYTLPRDTHVSLTLYSVRGRVIRRLVDQHKKAGSHAVTLSATEFPSGLYFYRLQTGSFTRVRKMMNIK